MIPNEPLSELASRLRSEQWQRWQAGDNVRAETYLEQFPTLRSAAEYAIDLIYSEFLLREELGQQPSPEEYLHRFPEFGQELDRQFTLHRGLTEPEVEGDWSAAVPARAFPARGDSNPDMPAQIGRFEIRQRIGMGGFGSVYRAHDPQLGREVALKVPHPHLLDDANRERFLREARAAAQLRHANLVAVFDSGISPAGCYIAYQLVTGRTLAEALKQRAFTPPEAAELVSKLARAAHHAHVQGVFHRDLKTTNVLLDETGEPFISDFGLVRFEGESTLTADAAVLGTPAYMPPEQAAGASHQADARSDVYTLGIVLYELITGRLPFSGPPQSVLRQVLEEDPISVRTLNRDVPRDLETICLKAMAKRPADRYGTAQELADDLQRWSRHEPIRARAVGLLPRLWKWSRRRPATAALVGVSLAAVFALFVIGTWYNLRLRAANLRAQQLLAHTTQMLSHAHAERGVQLLDGGDSTGLLYLLEARAASEEHRRTSDSRALLWAGWYDACAGRLEQMVGDDAPVLTAVFNRDQTQLITASANGVYRWDSETGARVGDPIPHSPQLIAAIDDARTVLATAPIDAAPQIWDLETGELRPAQFPPVPAATAIALSPDGSLVAVASGSFVWIGEVETGQFFSEPLRHGGDVGASMAFSADNRLLVTTARLPDLGMARIWRIDRAGSSAEPVDQPLIHDQEIVSVAVSVAFSPARIATASRDNTARLWRETGTPYGEVMRHREGVSLVAFSSDGTRVATGSFDGTARVWNGANGRPLTEPMRHQGPVRAISFNSAGNLLATGALDGSVRLWNTATGKLQGWPFRHLGDVTTVSFSSDSRFVVSASASGSVRIWNAAPKPDTVRMLSHDSRVYSLSLGRKTGQLLATGCGDGAVCVWNCDQGRLVFDPVRPGIETIWVAIGPEEDVLACGPCGSSPNRVELRRIDTGLPVGEPFTLRGPLRSMAFSPDGKVLATGSANGSVQLWDATERDGRVRNLHYSSDALNQPIAALAFSRDAQLLAFSSDRAVRVWELVRNQLYCPPLWHDGPVEAVAFSTDRNRIATVSRGVGVRLWMVEEGTSEVVQTIRPPANVQAVAFSPDGKLLATAAADGAVRLWDVETGLACGPPFSHDAFATAVGFTPDADWLATASFDKTARLWRLPRHLGESNFALMRLRTAVALGARLDPQGTIESIHWTEWQRIRRELDQQD